MRGHLVLPRGASQDTARAAALAEERVGRFLGDSSISKIVFVPDRLINLVLAAP